MRILSTKEMRKIESDAINKIGIPSICLMESAGKDVAYKVKDYIIKKDKSSILIVCGKGNNGGDGYVIARYLHNFGFDVRVFILTDSALIKGDAKINLNIIKNMGIFVAEILEMKQIKFFEKNIKECDVVIDAIYGTGLNGEVVGIAKEIINIINESEKYVISVDIPSGINGDTGHIQGIAVKANETMTMQFIKKGLVVYPGAEYAGKIEIAEIGIQNDLMDKCKNSYNLITDEDVILKKRARNTHKGDYGKILIVAGSKNMTGAAALCALSAIKTGCGIVRLACPRSIQVILQSQLKEVITYGLKDNDGILIKDAAEEILRLSDDYDAVAIGPGLSNNNETTEIMNNVISNIKKPLVIDADGLNAISSNVEIVKDKEIIMTPHVGEMSRLTGISIPDIKNNIFDVAEDFINKYNVTIVLKDSRTVIGSKTNGIYINNTGNPGMATAGSGDVLTGMIVSFLGQGFSLIDAAVYGVYYHGKAGDLAARKYGEYGLISSNIIEFIHESLNI